MKSFPLFVLAICVAGAVWHFARRAPSSPPPPPPAPPTAAVQPATVPPTAVPKEVPRNEPRPLIDVPAPEITLTLGRVLHDVKVLSFAETAVSVVHRDGKQIVPYEQFPAEYRQALLDAKPKPKVLDAKEEAQKAALVREKERKKSEEARLAKTKKEEEERSERTKRAQEERAAMNAEFDLLAHERAVRSHAYSYFNSKYDPTGSGSGYITDISIETRPAEAISGWTGRYRVSGTASFRLYESRGGSMNQGSRGFEATTEQKGYTCRVIDFVLK